MSLIVYRFLINFIFFVSPFIIILRLLKKKENFFRFKEKFLFFSQRKYKKKLLWFHGASVGELLSIIPLIEKLEKNKKIDQILVTTSTVSSSKVFNNFNFKKTVHQFFPIDTNFISKKFLDYWEPSLAIFIDSEIWPNMILNLKKKKIPIMLLNARITKKTFNRWKLFKNFSKEIFKCFYKVFPCNKETENYLRFLGSKKITPITNLKFSQKIRKKTIPLVTKKFFSKKIFWCAASTHSGEEEICFKIHNNLKKKYKKIITIIIPRHIDRKSDLIELINSYNLKFHCHSWSKKIPQDLDVYLVDTYGDTEIFFSLSKVVFIGGSIVKHGGQNPLEATRYGCKIIHGPHVENFRDIYSLLNKCKISKKIISNVSLENNIEKFLIRPKNSKQMIRKINKIGFKVLRNTFVEINKIF